MATEATHEKTRAALGDERSPEGPTDLTRPSWKDVLKRSVKEFRNDNLTDWAAALTYYAVLAMFPAILVLVSLLGVIGSGPALTNGLLDVVGELGPQSAVDTLRGPIESIVASQGAAVTLLSVGLLGALFSASGYVAAFTRASNAIYEIEEGRPAWKLRPFQILVTILLLLIAAAVVVALVVSGSVAESIGKVIGVADVAVTIWSIAKWPVVVILVMTAFAILYYLNPNIEQPRFRWFTPGAALALVAWVLASLAFGFYVANFGSYNETYGTLGGVIIFLVWLWITNIAVLLGAELNAELERGRELEAGLPAKEEIQLPPREEPDD
ncbi:MAG TPA: YihY/virulence factor BrkB family protein [Thermoleophilaceae bacterium]|nr:YihY/virulence factor BrkB family protein [Thermoleophilaceae bacterium]